MDKSDYSPNPGAVTIREMDNVLRHLAMLKKIGSRVSVGPSLKRRGNVIEIGVEERLPQISALVHDLNENGFVLDADWTRWKKELAPYVAEPERLRTATLPILQKLLTVHLRQDHFCEGHFSAMVRCGHITAVLERLKEIRKACAEGREPSLPPNPWVNLPRQSPFVLPGDKDAISQFNSTKADHESLIHTEILPEPFLGNRNAPVVLLNLNPGFKEKDTEWHANPEFARRNRANLCHKRVEYPFYLLDPEIERTQWWEQRLKPLIDRVGSAKTVAERVFCVEFFPYHSRKFRHRNVIAPSRAYSLALVRRAIARKAVILLMRGGRYWLGQIPELAEYEKFFASQNPRKPYISPGNFRKGFEAAVRAIRM